MNPACYHLGFLDHVGCLGPQLSLCSSSFHGSTLISLKEYILELSILPHKSDESKISIVTTLGDAVVQFYNQHKTGSSSLYVLATLCVRALAVPGSLLHSPRIGHLGGQLSHARSQWLQALNLFQAVHSTVCRSLSCSFSDVIDLSHSASVSVAEAEQFVALRLQHCLPGEWSAGQDDISLPMQLARGVCASLAAAQVRLNQKHTPVTKLTTSVAVGGCSSTSRVYPGAVMFRGDLAIRQTVTSLEGCHLAENGACVSIALPNPLVIAINFGYVEYVSDNAATWSISSEWTVSDIYGSTLGAHDVAEQEAMLSILTRCRADVVLCANASVSPQSRRLFDLCAEVCKSREVLLLLLPEKELLSCCELLELEVFDWNSAQDLLLAVDEARYGGSKSAIMQCLEMNIHIYEGATEFVSTDGNSESDAMVRDDPFLFVVQFKLDHYRDGCISPLVELPVVVVVCHRTGPLCAALADRFQRCLQRLLLVLPVRDTGAAPNLQNSCNEMARRMLPGAGAVELCCCMCIDELLRKVRLVGVQDGPKGRNFAKVLQTQAEHLAGASEPFTREGEFDYVILVSEVEQPLRALQAALRHFVSVLHNNCGARGSDFKSFDNARIVVARLVAGTEAARDSVMLWDGLEHVDRKIILCSFPSPVSAETRVGEAGVLDVAEIKLAVMRRAVKLTRDLVSSWR